MKEPLKKYLAILSLTLIPMFFGSFIFVGVLESYKNNEALNNSILDGYKQIQIKGQAYFKAHGELISLYSQYNIILTIVREILNDPASYQDDNLSIEYEAFVDHFIEICQELPKELDRINEDSARSYGHLHIAYDELALLLDFTDDYDEEIVYRDYKLNNLLSKRQQYLETSATNFDLNELIRLLKVGIENSSNNQRDKWLSLLDKLSEFVIEMANFEKRKYDIELSTYSSLRKEYIEKIKERMDRNFIEYVLGI